MESELTQQRFRPGECSFQVGYGGVDRFCRQADKDMAEQCAISVKYAISGCR